MKKHSSNHILHLITLREIRGSFGRFFAIFAIGALGVGFFSGVRITKPVMVHTMDEIMKQTAFYDYRLLSNYGWEEEDVQRFREAEGVRAAEGAYSRDTLCENKEGEIYAMAVLSLGNEVNRLELTDGRLPENTGECVLDDRNRLDLELGDSIVISPTNDEDTLDFFTRDSFTVVGFANSPCYVNFERGTTTIGNGSLTGFLYVPAEAFNAEYYTEAYVKLEEEPEIFSDDYNDLIDGQQETWEDLVQEGADARFGRILEDAEAELADAKAEFEDKKAEGEQELADAETELADAKTELDDAKAELEDGEAQLADAEAELTDAKAQLDDAKAQLDDGKAELDKSAKEIAAGEKQLADSKKELDAAKQELDDAKAQLDDGEAQLSATRTQLDEAAQQLSDTESQLTAAKKELDATKPQLDAAKKQLDATKKELDAAKKQLDSTNKQLTDKQTELDAAKADLDAAKAELDTAAAEIAAGEAEWAANKQQVEAAKAAGILSGDELAAAEAELAAARTALDEAQETYEAGDAEYQAGLTQYNTGAAALTAGWTQYSEALEQYKAGKDQYDKGLAEYESGLAQYETGLAQYETGKAAYEKGLAEYQAGEQAYQAAYSQYQEGKTKYEEGLAQYESGLAKYQKAEADLTAGKAKYNQGLADYQAGLAEYEQGKADYEQGLADYEEAKQKLEDGRREYEDGLAEYQDALAEYEDGKQTFDEEIADAQSKIDEAEQDIADLDEPEGYLLDRSMNNGYVCFESDSEIVASVAKVFPLFFILVAVLVCMTTMTRMVEDQRSQIGLLKGLGYSRGAIMSGFLAYSGIASLLGCIVGYGVGIIIFPTFIWQPYQLLYFQHALNYKVDFVLAAATTAVALLCMLGTTYLSCRFAFAECAASLMRPRAPKAGKRVLLERIPWLWSRMRFLRKVSVRNIFRYKKRLFMMMLGIGGCMALLITGFGLSDSITGFTQMQFGEIQSADASIYFRGGEGGELPEDLAQTLDEMGAAYFPYRQASWDLLTGKISKNINLLVPMGEDLQDFFVMADEEGNELPMPGEGEALISVSLSKRYGIKTGDTITVRNEDMKSVTAKVSGVFENYVYHYVVLSPESLAGIEDQENANGAYINFAEGTDAYTAQAELAKCGSTSSVMLYKELVDMLDNMLTSMDYIVWIILLSAGGLAFIVVYNLTNINIVERIREIATIKVLGFNRWETMNYVFRENLLLCLFGVLAGFALGIWLHSFVMNQIQIDLVFFRHIIKPVSFLYAAVLTFGFTFFVNLVMSVKLERVNMAESLKSVE